MVVLDRVMVRLSGEDSIDVPFIEEAILMIEDRLKLRLGVELLPPVFQSITVDAVVKVYRRKYYEGIKIESMDTISTHFMDDVLSEYEKDIRAYIQSKEISSFKNVVRFV